MIVQATFVQRNSMLLYPLRRNPIRQRTNEKVLGRSTLSLRMTKEMRPKDQSDLTLMCTLLYEYLWMKDMESFLLCISSTAKLCVDTLLCSHMFYTVEGAVIQDESVIHNLGFPLATDEFTARYVWDDDYLSGVMTFPIFGAVGNGMVTCQMRHVGFRTWEIYQIDIDTNNGVSIPFIMHPDKRVVRLDDLMLQEKLEDFFIMI